MMNDSIRRAGGNEYHLEEAILEICENQYCRICGFQDGKDAQPWQITGRLAALGFRSLGDLDLEAQANDKRHGISRISSFPKYFCARNLLRRTPVHIRLPIAATHTTQRGLCAEFRPNCKVTRPRRLANARAKGCSRPRRVAHPRRLRENALTSSQGKVGRPHFEAKRKIRRNTSGVHATSKGTDMGLLRRCWPCDWTVSPFDDAQTQPTNRSGFLTHEQRRTQRHVLAHSKHIRYRHYYCKDVMEKETEKS
ncbi:hypothetical protein K456DRAFT_56984 [Colletotrichum gloeosporioides 23]|nr:hypothetical protein K456DRAFT_56984 [Colletotrichum gloeosporioides 23]